MKLQIETEDIVVLSAMKKAFAEIGNVAGAEHIDKYIDSNRLCLAKLSRKGLTESDSSNAPRMLKIFDILEAEGLLNLFVGNGLITHSRIGGFAQDADFVAAANSTRSLLPVPCWEWNLNTALWAVTSCLNLSGDCVELGVFRGHTVLFVQEYMKKKGMAVQNWFLYDTFEGVPEEEITTEFWKIANAGTYGPGTYSYQEVVERFEPFPQTTVIKGRVPDVFDETPLPDAICFAHIDMNSATAEAAALEQVYPRLAQGGMILLDDHGWLQCMDQNEAHKEWAKSQRVTILELPTGQGLIVKN